MRRCYWLTGLTHANCFSCNAGFLVGDRETVIVDAGNNAESAETILEFAKAVAPDNSIRMAIALEGHYDHTFGLAFFKQRGAEIWAHASVGLTQEELSAYIESCNEELSIPRRRKNKEACLYFKGVEPFTPDVGITEDMRLEIDGLRPAIYLAPGHTPSNLILFEETEGVLYAADTIYSGFLPTMAFGDVPLWQSWLQALDRIEALRPSVLVPGHGMVLRGDEIQLELNRHRELLHRRIEAL